MAVARAAAASHRAPLYRYLGGVNACLLPVPMMNILNGGAHADNSVDPQEFMIVPYGADEVFRSAALGRRGLPHAEGRSEEARLFDRGGRRRRLRAQPQIERRSARSGARSHHARPATSRATRSASRSIRRPANSTTATKRSTFSRNPTRASGPPSRWSKFWADWVRQYPIVSIEDGMAEDDWAGWKTMTDRAGRQDPTGRRRSVRHQHRAPGARASRKASPIRF